MKPRFSFKEEFSREEPSSLGAWHYPSSDQPAAEDGVAPPLPPPIEGLSEMEPTPIEGLSEMEPSPFLIKAFDMVDDLTTNHIVSWYRGGHSFVVWDLKAFSTSLLPKYFKHNNFSSFIRQLNTYRFKKMDAEKWEFANEAFVRGQKHLLTKIGRRRAPSQFPPQQQACVGPCVELGRYGHEAEVDRLRRDKEVLTMELVKLRQEQQSTRLHLQHIEMRLCETEKKKQLMMRLLAKAMKNPDLTHKLLQHKMKLKRRITNQSDEVLNEERFQVSELEALALEMQGLGKGKREREREREDDDGFWEELLNVLGFEFDDCGKNEDEDVNGLVDRFGFLGSSSK